MLDCSPHMLCGLSFAKYPPSVLRLHAEAPNNGLVGKMKEIIGEVSPSLAVRSGVFEAHTLVTAPSRTRGWTYATRMRIAALLSGKRGYKRTAALIQQKPPSARALTATIQSHESVNVETDQASI